MQLPIWRSIPILRNPLSQSPQLALFHSTPAYLAKWKSKWSQQDDGRAQPPPKNYIRYAVRQKRADAKRALKDLLLNGRSPKLSSQDEDISWQAYRNRSRNLEQEDSSNDFDDQPQSKTSGNSKPQHSSSGKDKRNKNKRRKNNRHFYSDNEDDMHRDTIFQATFGNRFYTWSFRPWSDSHSQNSTSGFEWRDGSESIRNRRAWESSESDDDSNWEKNKRRARESSESEDDSGTIGLCSYRVTLGLPPTGPLKINDVKDAFRASALKWHPDKHQGPSQSMAEEKFKICVNAYKSLCNALKSP